MTNIDSPPRRRNVLFARSWARSWRLRLASSYTGRLRRPARPRAIARPTRPSSRRGSRPSPRANWRRSRCRASPGGPSNSLSSATDGGKLTVADFKGRPILLNLWATWCVPCRAEMPTLDRLQAAKGGPGFEVVAVNVDTARLEKRGAFLDGVGVKTLARYADPSGDAFETLRKAGRALGLPVTLVIDKDGCEVAAVEGGAKWDSAEAQALVEALKGG